MKRPKLQVISPPVAEAIQPSRCDLQPAELTELVYGIVRSGTLSQGNGNISPWSVLHTTHLPFQSTSVLPMWLTIQSSWHDLVIIAQSTQCSSEVTNALGLENKYPYCV